MDAPYSRHMGHDDITNAAGDLAMNLSPAEHETFAILGDVLGDLMAGADGLPLSGAPRLYARRDLLPAEAREDPFNAVARWCTVKCTTSGDGRKLDGIRLAVKDCIAVAEIPMTGGSHLLVDFTPTMDATVISRALAAGAEIRAITNMDDLAMCASGDSSAYGPTLSPFNPSHLAGGSSSGSAAALHYDTIDMALGTDTGGSVRVPAAWCGVVGFKPTHGLVPYTGVLAIDRLLDHVGTLTRTVNDAARLLAVISGPDGLDPIQSPDVRVPDFEAALSSIPSLRGRRIAIVTETLHTSTGVDPLVREAVLAVAHTLEAAGVEIIECSMPEHLAASAVIFGMLAEGIAATVTTRGNGSQRDGTNWPELALAVATGRQQNTDRLSPQVKLSLLAGTIMRRQTAGTSYAHAANSRPAITHAYDQALAGIDALLMPTTPGLPLELNHDLPLAERILRSWTPLTNTSATNITGHPAISLPLALANDLPVGVMLTGHRHHDAELLALAHAIESTIGWTTPHRKEEGL